MKVAALKVVITRKTAGLHFLFYGVSGLWGALVGLASSAIFTRMFPAETYGVYSLTLTIVGLATSLGTEWIRQPVVRELSGTVSGVSAQLMAGIIVGTATSFVIGGLGAGVAFIWEVPLAVKQYVVAGVMVFVANVSADVLFAVARAQLHAGAFALLTLLRRTVTFVAGLGLAMWVYRSPLVLLWGAAIGSVVTLVPLLLVTGVLPAARGVHGWLKTGVTQVREFAGYGLPMLAWVVASSVLQVGDRWVIAAYRSSAEVGIYSANYSLAVGSIGLVLTPLQEALNPLVLGLWNRDERKRAAAALGSAISCLISAGFVVVGMLMVVQHEVAQLLLGHAFREGVTILPIVVGGLVVMSAANYLHKPFEFTKRTPTMGVAALGAAVLNVVLNIAFVPRYGYVSAAWTTLASYAAYAVAVGALGRRLIYWRLEYRLPVLGVLGATSGVLVGRGVLSMLEGAHVVVRLLVGSFCYGVAAAAPLMLAYRARMARAVSRGITLLGRMASRWGSGRKARAEVVR